VSPAESPRGLTDAAQILSGQLRIYLKRLAERIRPEADQLDRRFQNRLGRLGYDARHAETLLRISSGAAARLLARGRPPAEFFEQVAYNGRRLAKLGLTPTGTTAALAEYDRLLTPVLRRSGADEFRAYEWARQQLQFCVVLTLNNAYHEVREAEAQAFYEMFRAELESAGLDELLSRFLVILAGCCRADAGVLLIDTGEGGIREVRLGKDRKPVVSVRARERTAPWKTPKLSEPRHVQVGEAGLWLPDARWRRRYRSCWSVPLKSGGPIAGLLQLCFAKSYQWLPRERELLEAAAERCVRAAEKAWFVEHLAARERQVRELAERMLHVEERERRRLSRELHDQTGQDLLCMRLKLELLEPGVDGEIRRQVAEVRKLTEGTIVEVRRLIAALSPAVLEQLGLSAALRQLGKRLRELASCEVKLELGRMAKLPKELEVIAYRLVQECTSNIAKHSQARHVNIRVGSADGVLSLRVVDDGIGFSPTDALRQPNSFGLAGIRERVALLGGSFVVESRPRTSSGAGSRWPARLRSDLGRRGELGDGSGLGTRIAVDLPIRPQGVRPGTGSRS